MAHPLVFIVGAGHSGSTLLTMVLGAHPQVTALSEANWFDQWVRNNDPCSCGVPVRSCSLWSEVMDRIASRRGVNPQNFAAEFPIDLATAFDRSRPAMKLVHASSIVMVRLLPISLWQHVARRGPLLAIRLRTRNALEFYDSVLEVTGRLTLVDSSKSVYRLLHIYLQRPEAVRAIYLTRDGRAVTSSLMKHNGYPGGTAIRRWKLANVYTRHMLRRLPEAQRMHVRYEELCCDPERTVRRVCGFLDLTYEPSMLRFRRVPQHLIGGNDMQYRTDDVIVQDTSWRAKLPADVRQAFERTAGRLNRALLGEYFSQ